VLETSIFRCSIGSPLQSQGSLAVEAELVSLWWRLEDRRSTSEEKLVTQPPWAFVSVYVGWNCWSNVVLMWNIIKLPFHNSRPIKRSHSLSDDISRLSWADAEATFDIIISGLLYTKDWPRLRIDGTGLISSCLQDGLEIRWLDWAMLGDYNLTMMSAPRIDTCASPNAACIKISFLCVIWLMSESTRLTPND